MDSQQPIIGFRIEVVVEPDDIGFHAYCPALKGLHTRGDTPEEARSNARDAAIAYLDSSIKHGDPIPVGIVLQKEPSRKSKPTSSKISHHTEDLQIACATS